MRTGDYKQSYGELVALADSPPVWLWSAVAIAALIVAYAADKKAIDIAELDLSGVLGYTDFFVVCSGNTDRQTKAIHDRIYEGIIARSLTETEHGDRRDGTPELMSGAVVVAVLAVVIIAVSGSAAAAILICGLLAALLFCGVTLTAKHQVTDRTRLLADIGGPGRLPAGYLVHHKAWAAGMAEHVAHVPEAQLRAAADLCHLFPGTVDNLLFFVGNLAIHVPAEPHPTPGDVTRRARELVRIGGPVLREHVKDLPPLPVPPEVKGSKDKK